MIYQMGKFPVLLIVMVIIWFVERTLWVLFFIVYLKIYNYIVVKYFFNKTLIHNSYILCLGLAKKQIGDL